MTGFIYLLAFSNGKGYVGLTTRDPRRRFSQHKTAAALGKRQSRIYKAWRKHGEPKMIILARAPLEKLQEVERLLIQICGTLDPGGYNLSEGGEGAWGVKVSEETRAKLRASALGRKMSDGARMKMSEIAKRRRPSEATRAKMSAAHAGRPKSRNVVEKQARTITGRKRGPLHVEKTARALRGKKQRPEHIAARAASNTGRKNTSETIEKMRRAALSRNRLDKAVNCPT